MILEVNSDIWTINLTILKDNMPAFSYHMLQILHLHVSHWFSRTGKQNCVLQGKEVPYFL